MSMLASDIKHENGINFTSLVKCLRNVLIAISCMAIATQIFGWAAEKYGYFRYYNFIPGQYTGYRLQQLTNLSSDKTCLILGASTAREAFDIEKLEAEFPEFHFLTFATTAGHNASSVIDIQASLIPKNTYPCIVLGMHPFFLVTPDDTSHNLEKTNYISQISLFKLIDISQMDENISLGELRLIAGIGLIPNMRHSEILGKHIRKAIFNVTNWVRRGKSVITDMEYTRGELGEQVTHIRYNDERSSRMESFLERRLKFIRSYDLENPQRYRTSIMTEKFKAALAKLDGLTDRLIVLDLPETPIYDSVLEASSSFFVKAVLEAAPEAEIYKCDFQFTKPHDGFVDTIHVNSKGREYITKELMLILNGQSENQLCRPMKLH